MGYIGGDLQERFVERIRGLDPARLLAVPIDVGKASAAAMVCDFWGEVVTPPFTFPITEPGVEVFTSAVARAEAARDAAWVRAGLEQAGHYHRTLLVRLEQVGIEVALLNPAQVKEDRNQSLLRSLKSDATDLGAMAELLVRGKGHPPAPVDDAMATQAALTAHRARKVKARSAVKNHVHASLDLVFPGLSGCFFDLLETKLGRLLLDEGMGPERIRRLGVERMRTFCAHRGVMVHRRKALEILAAARGALSLAPQVREVHAGVLASDVALLGTFDTAIAEADEALGEGLPHTPAGDPHLDASGGRRAGLELRRGPGRSLTVPHRGAGLSDGRSRAPALRVRRQEEIAHLDLPGGQGGAAGRDHRAGKGTAPR